MAILQDIGFLWVCVIFSVFPMASDVDVQCLVQQRQQQPQSTLGTFDVFFVAAAVEVFLFKKLITELILIHSKKIPFVVSTSCVYNGIGNQMHFTAIFAKVALYSDSRCQTIWVE